jgi:LPXTG-site transpeptidase (sortase) family protein
MMMSKLRNLWTAYGKWPLITMLILAVAICVTMRTSMKSNDTITMAEAPTEADVTFDMDTNRAYTAEDGIVVIPASFTPASNAPAGMKLTTTAFVPSAADTLSEAAPAAVPVKAGGNYTLPEDAQMPDGSIGVLSIPKLSLSVNVYETEDEMEAMSRGVAHFKTTSSWAGNIGLCSHNVNFDLSDGYFKNIHTLNAGDSITYQTALGTRTYVVQPIAEIAETDWSYLNRTDDNRVTLITCISGKPTSRLVVQAVSAD